MYYTSKNVKPIFICYENRGTHCLPTSQDTTEDFRGHLFRFAWPTRHHTRQARNTSFPRDCQCQSRVRVSHQSSITSNHHSRYHTSISPCPSTVPVSPLPWRSLASFHNEGERKSQVSHLPSHQPITTHPNPIRHPPPHIPPSTSYLHTHTNSLPPHPRLLPTQYY